jgi:hypothetical protein
MPCAQDCHPKIEVCGPFNSKGLNVFALRNQTILIPVSLISVLPARREQIIYSGCGV